VILDGHGDDVDADDGRDGQVEVLAAGDGVKGKPRSGVARPVGQRSPFYAHQPPADVIPYSLYTTLKYLHAFLRYGTVFFSKNANAAILKNFEQRNTEAPDSLHRSESLNS